MLTLDGRGGGGNRTVAAATGRGLRGPGGGTGRDSGKRSGISQGLVKGWAHVLAWGRDKPRGRSPPQARAGLRRAGAQLQRQRAGLGAGELADPVRAGGAADDERDATRKFLRSATIVAPRAMTGFALVSGDHNPIHTDANAAALAGLGEPIVHGMWLSAAAQQVVSARDTRRVPAKGAGSIGAGGR